MSFHGRYRKGYMKTLREQKREEAEARNSKKQSVITQLAECDTVNVEVSGSNPDDGAQGA